MPPELRSESPSVFSTSWSQYYARFSAYPIAHADDSPVRSTPCRLSLVLAVDWILCRSDKAIGYGRVSPTASAAYLGALGCDFADAPFMHHASCIVHRVAHHARSSWISFTVLEIPGHNSRDHPARTDKPVICPSEGR